MLQTLRSLRCAILLSLLAAEALGAAEPELVNIKSVDPTILVELRYGTSRNIVGRPLYPPNMPALVRPSVAQKLAKAQSHLREKGYGLKIWDAYRPKVAHDQLWQLSPNNDYVADPVTGGSLHTWGVAVDATIVDNRGKQLQMPTDFDEFTPAAMLYYNGADQIVRRNLLRLQNAMARAGFYGMRTEWWHFVDKEWQNYRPIPEVTLIAATPANTAVPPPVAPVPPPSAPADISTRPAATETAPALAPAIGHPLPGRTLTAAQLNLARARRATAAPPKPASSPTPTAGTPAGRRAPAQR